MASETRYIVVHDGRKGAPCRRLDAAECIARQWVSEGKTGVYIEKRTVTRKRIYSV